MDELPARLRAVADLVLAGAPMADIGTDHAQLPVWLVAHGRIPSAIAIDVAEGPLQAARATAAEVPGVQVRAGDGLHPLHDGEVATIVLAGMGGASIRRIVSAGLPAGVRRLVLQPNTEWAATRAFIAEQRWTLHDERIVHDRGKFYVVLAVTPEVGAEPWIDPGWTHADLELGPVLRTRRDAVWRAWVDATRATLERAAAAAAAGGNPDDPQVQELRHRLAIFASA